MLWHPNGQKHMQCDGISLLDSLGKYSMAEQMHTEKFKKLDEQNSY